MAFGLFVPEFRQDFSLSTSTVGGISSLGFLGFLLGLWAAQGLLSRGGPARPVLAGLTAATAGLTSVALASNPVLLAFGVFLAASSAGFTWTPFNDAVQRWVQADARPGVLSWISTGTATGIAGAGATAVALGGGTGEWRLAWGLFALASAAVLVLNGAALLPLHSVEAEASTPSWPRLFARRSARPLMGLAFVYGITSAVFLTFATDHLRAGAQTGASSGWLFVAYGGAGSVGIWTGRLGRLLGLEGLVRFLLGTGALSLALTAAGSGAGATALTAAGLQGIYVMMTSAVLSFWSAQLFSDAPSGGFTAALLATAAGSVAGPAGAGFLAESCSPDVMFGSVAAIPILTAFTLKADGSLLRRQSVQT